MLILGDQAPTGAYLLWIVMRRAASFAFGRFRGGQPIPTPAGEYVYIGSAMAPHGAGALAARLIRHATRSGRRRPHPIRAPLMEALAAAGLPCRLPRSPKTLFWNVDYLLDRPEACLAGVIAIRSTCRLESALAGWLDAGGYGCPLAPGLGAGDAPGETHLVRLAPGAWTQLAARIDQVVRVPLPSLPAVPAP